MNHNNGWRRSDLVRIATETMTERGLEPEFSAAVQAQLALITKPGVGPVPTNWRPYVDKLPADPWGRPYQYLNPGIKGEIDVLSFGADGQAGGEGKNADIGSWQ